MGRRLPTGIDTNAWRLWLLENAAAGAGYLAKQIAAAMGGTAVEVKPKPVGRGDEPKDLTNWPRIIGRTTTRISPWVTLIAREVEFSPDAESETYHSIETFDYVIVLAQAPDGRIPLVRQYRPAVEDFTFEFPGGIIDTAEGAAGTATRELLEETGFPSKTVHLMGVTKNDAGRLGNRVHSYFIETEPQMLNFQPEEGVAIHIVTPSELVQMIIGGSFDAQANLGTLLLAEIRGRKSN